MFKNSICIYISLRSQQQLIHHAQKFKLSNSKFNVFPIKFICVLFKHKFIKQKVVTINQKRGRELPKLKNVQKLLIIYGCGLKILFKLKILSISNNLYLKMIKRNICLINSNNNNDLFYYIYICVI